MKMLQIKLLVPWFLLHIWWVDFKFPCSPPPTTTLFIALFFQAASTKTIFLKTNGKNVPWNILEGISLYDKQNSLTIIKQWSLYLANIHGNITSVYINGGCLYHKSYFLILSRIKQTVITLFRFHSIITPKISLYLRRCFH